MLRFNFKNLEVGLGHLMIIMSYSVSHSPLSVSESDESDEITTSRK